MTNVFNYSYSPLSLLQVDMTLTKKDLLAAVKLCNNEPGAHATIPTRYRHTELEQSLLTNTVLTKCCFW